MAEKRDDNTQPSASMQDLLKLALEDASRPMEQRFPFWTEIRKLLVVNRVGRLVNATLDVKAVLNEVVQRTAETLRVQSCCIYLIEEERLVLRAAVGRERRAVGKLGLRMGQGVTGWVAQTRQPAAVQDVRADERSREHPFSAEQRYPCILSVPLILGDSLLGVINVQDDHEREFSYQEIGLLSNLAGHVVGAIRNAQLYQDASSRLGELQSLQEMRQVISSTLDLPDLLFRMCRLSAESVKADGSIVRLWDLERGLLDVQASHERLRRARIEDLYRLEAKFAVRSFEEDEVVAEAEPVSSPKGQRRFVSFLCVPIRTPRRQIGVVSVFRIRGSQVKFSVSAIRLIRSLAEQAAIAIQNAELFAQAREAKHALREAQAELLGKQKLAALGNVAAGLAHELRNPLVSIGGFAARIRRNLRDDTKAGNYARIIQAEVERLEELINETLLYASPESPKNEVIDLPSFFSEICRLVSEHSAGKKIVFRQHLADNARVIRGDPALLRRAFLNVLFNAAEIMKGKGEVQLVSRRAVEGEAVEVEVRDQGPGIKPRDLHRIFEPFFSQKKGGTGLGLSIAANIAAAHGGCLHAYNRPDGGAVFVFSFPLAEEGQVDAL